MSAAPAEQAEPRDTAMPNSSSASISASPVTFSNRILVVLATRGASIPLMRVSGMQLVSACSPCNWGAQGSASAHVQRAHALRSMNAGRSGKDFVKGAMDARMAICEAFAVRRTPVFHVAASGDVVLGEPVEDFLKAEAVPVAEMDFRRAGMAWREQECSPAVIWAVRRLRETSLERMRVNGSGRSRRTVGSPRDVPVEWSASKQLEDFPPNLRNVLSFATLDSL
jgi:hypothetical protein